MIVQELKSKNIKTQAGIFEKIEEAEERLNKNKIYNAIDLTTGRIREI